ADNPASYINGSSITQGFEDRSNDGGNVDYTNLLSSSTVFDLRVSFNKFTQERHPGLTVDPASLGFSASGVSALRGYQYFPMIEIRNLDAIRPIRADLGSMRSDWNLGRLRPFMMGSVQPTVTKTFGNHTAKFGWDFHVVRENFISNGYQG